jgi:N-acetylglucosamine-1-phosphodiester alpha-N-acetylglucosaminidase
MFRLENPINHFSIFPPEGGCQKDSRTKTSVTAKQHNCIAASNAGYFDVNTGTCLGNLVSNGTFIQGSRLRNPTFGVTKSGKAIIGYLGDALNTNDFQGEEILSLVQGIIWIVRNGKNNVDEALKVESSEAQSTGDFSYFARVKSARTALGIDTHGNIITVTVEGKTGIEGIDLYQLADLLINVGVVSAINLDGGGSAQAVLKGELVTFPSDECPDHAKSFEYCERIITSITCMHDFNIQRKNNDTDPKKTDFFDKDSNQYSGKLILAIAFGTIFGATICVFLIRYLVHKCRAISLEKHYLNEEDQHSLETLSEDLKGKPLTLDSDGADVDLEPGSN